MDKKKFENYLQQVVKMCWNLNLGYQNEQNE